MCTGIYVGRKCSTDGSVIIARSCDYASNLNLASTISCNPQKTYTNKNKIYSGINKMYYPVPKLRYKFLGSPAFPSKLGILKAIGANENGVVATATITAYTCKEILNLDPRVETGIPEDIISELVGAYCKSAREGVEFLGEYINKYGSYHENIVFIADKKETWMMDLYTGHEWAAIKMPDNKISVFGNQFMIQSEYADLDSKSFIHSKKLFELPKKAGCVIKKKGHMSLCETYGGKDRLADYANMRTYIGHYYFAKSSAGHYKTKKRFPLFFKPDKKVDILDALDLMRNRFENSEVEPTKGEIKKTRFIGTEAQHNVHAIQIFKNLPKEMCIVPWICLTNCEHSIFLPYSNLQTKVAKEYNAFDAEHYNEGNQTPHLSDGTKWLVYSNDIAAICYRKLCYLSELNREKYGTNVRKHWKLKETQIRKELPKVLKKTHELLKTSDKKAINYINKYMIKIEKECLAEARALFDELMWHAIGQADTFKYKLDYDELKLKKKTNMPESFIPTLFFLDKHKKELGLTK